MKGNARRRCLLLRDSRQTSLLFPLDGMQQVEVKDGGFCCCSHILVEFCSVPASAPAEVSGVTVFARVGMSAPFSLTR